MWPFRAKTGAITSSLSHLVSSTTFVLDLYWSSGASLASYIYKQNVKYNRQQKY